MASIQQSMNQLLGAVAGATTAGTYMYRQSDAFKARQAERGVASINKQFALHKDQTIAEASPEERARLLEAGKRGVQLREKAFETKPTAKRLEKIRKAEGSLETLEQGITEAEKAEQAEATAEAVTQAQAQENAEEAERIASGELVIGEDGSQTEITETQKPATKPAPPTKEELEVQKAHETVRRYIMGQDRIGSQQEQTLRFQQALQLLREKEGLN